MSPAYVDAPEALESVRRAGIPTMQVLRRIDARTELFPFASLDYGSGGRLATQHLVDLGARRVGFAGGLADGRSRPSGWRAISR